MAKEARKRLPANPEKGNAGSFLWVAMSKPRLFCALGLTSSSFCDIIIMQFDKTEPFRIIFSEN